jgi:hypothetical protein
LFEVIVCIHHDLKICLGFLTDDIHTSGTASHPVELEEGNGDGYEEDSDFCDKFHCPPTLYFHPHHLYRRILANKVALFDPRGQDDKEDHHHDCG